MTAVPSSVLFQQVAGELRHPTTRSSWTTFAIMIGSLGLFVVSLGDVGAREAGMIAGVLLFHEAGHWVGMRGFGYRDVRMFFIPFFGGAVSGEPDGVAPWKQGIVLLLGPLPGLVAAFALGIAFRATHAEWMKTLALSLAIVNGLNLAPIEPLDGGRILHLVLASRARFLDVLSPIFAAVALGLIGARLHAVTLYVLACLTLVGVPRRLRVLRAAAAVRQRHPALPGRIGEASDEQLADVFFQVQPVIRGADPVTDQRVRNLAAACRQVFERANSVPPRWAVSVLLGLLQVSGFALGLGAAVLVAIRVAGAPIEPLTHTDAFADGSLSVRHPSSFKAKVTETDGFRTILLTRAASGHAESVSFIATTSPAGAPDPRAMAMSLVNAKDWHVTVGASAECMGHPGVAIDGTADALSHTSALHGCVSAHGQQIVVAYWLAHLEIADQEAAQLRAILGGAQYAP